MISWGLVFLEIENRELKYYLRKGTFLTFASRALSNPD
jgi:hypothetical protein